MTHHAMDVLIHQFLSRSRALFRIGGIVFGQQFKLHFFATDGHAFGIELFNGHAGTVLVVLAQVGNGTTQRGHVANLDHILRQHLYRHGGQESR